MTRLFELEGFSWFIELLRRVLFSEYFLWLIAGGAVSVRFFLAYSRYPEKVSFLIEEYYFELLLGVLLVLFPFVFYQIFGTSPLQAIKKKRESDDHKGIIVHGDGNVIHMDKEERDSIKEGVVVTNAAQLLVQLTKSAELLANKIYTRSGVYLIFGVLIAFSGILYFSLQSISIAGEVDIVQVLITLAPRFGILFFIEFIAFFFLKGLDHNSVHPLMPPMAAGRAAVAGAVAVVAVAAARASGR